MSSRHHVHQEMLMLAAYFIRIKAVPVSGLNLACVYILASAHIAICHPHQPTTPLAMCMYPHISHQGISIGTF